MNQNDTSKPNLSVAAHDVEQIRTRMNDLHKIVQKQVSAGGDPKLLEQLREIEESMAKLNLPEMVAK